MDLNIQSNFRIPLLKFALTPLGLLGYLIREDQIVPKICFIAMMESKRAWSGLWDQTTLWRCVTELNPILKALNML